MASAPRVSSAGYRLPTRPTGPAAVQSASRARSGNGEAGGADSGRSDPVNQDRVWKERVRDERRGVTAWEINWGFLKNYDQMGRLKHEEPLPTNLSAFSNIIPNTSNQMFGSRLSTQSGKELIRLDRIYLWPGGHFRRKQDSDMLPY